MASPLTSIDNNIMGDSITLTKESGTILSLSTKEKYVPKNIQLTLDVQSGSAKVTANQSITANPTIAFSATNALTASYSGSKSITGTATAGWVSSVTAANVTTSGTTTVSSLTLPKAYSFTMNMAANTASDSSKLTINNANYRNIFIDNKVTTNSKISIKAKEASNSTAVGDEHIVVENGFWKTTAVSATGTFYGKVTVSAGTITNNTSGGTSAGTINRGKQIKIGKGFYANDSYYTAQANSGTITITASGNTTVDGYTTASVGASTITNNTTLPSGSTSAGTLNRGKYIKISKGYVNNDTYYLAQGNSGTLNITTSHNAQTNISCDGYANINSQGINIPNSKAFQVKVPNGTDSITFNFSVDANGNVLVT